MNENIVPSTSSEIIDKEYAGEATDDLLLKSINQLSDNLVKGCVCDVKNKYETNYINPSTSAFGAILRKTTKLLDGSQISENAGDILASMTFLKNVAKCSLNATFYEDSTDDELFCKTLWEWLVLMKKFKFKILQSILNLWKTTSNNIGLHIKREAESTFGYVFFIIPCPAERQEDCRKSCQKMVQTFIQQKYNPELPMDMSFVLRLLSIIICEIDEPDSKRHKQLIKNSTIHCRNSKVFIKVSVY